MVTILALLSWFIGWSTEQTGFIARACTRPRSDTVCYWRLPAVTSMRSPLWERGGCLLPQWQCHDHGHPDCWQRMETGLVPHSGDCGIYCCCMVPKIFESRIVAGRPKRKSLSLSFSFFSGAADLRCEGSVSAECERTCPVRTGAAGSPWLISVSMA